MTIKKFQKNLDNLSKINISITGYSLSHLGYKTSTVDAYQKVCRELKKLSSLYYENEHNGRPISKFILKESLQLPSDFSVNLTEVMPPKPNKHYPNGLEHAGVVIGNQFTEFTQKYQSLFTGKQDQGPFCQPVYIRFDDGSRIKFYQYSLQDVVELEGNKFFNIIP